MRILVISDTHNRISDALWTIDKLKPDYTFHLGDMAEDCDDIQSAYPSINFNAVLGNNDYFNRRYSKELLVTIDSVKIFMCHGHTYHVKSGLYELKKAARSSKSDIALFGHTHNSTVEYENGLYCVNPGSGSTSYALIETNGGKPKIEIHYFDE